MARSGYFHGDLRRALLDAGVDAARASGPEALSLRELARIVEVAPSAVYRHFESREQLVSALVLRTLGMVADAMEDEIASRAERPILMAAFQREQFWRASETRWRNLAQISSVTNSPCFAPTRECSS